MFNSASSLSSILRLQSTLVFPQQVANNTLFSQRFINDSEKKQFNLNRESTRLGGAGFCLPLPVSELPSACPSGTSPPSVHTVSFHQEAKMLLLMMSVLLLIVLLACIHFFSDASLSESLISTSGTYPSFSLSDFNLLFALSLAGTRPKPK